MTPATNTRSISQQTLKTPAHEKPSFDDILDALGESGLSPEAAGALLNLFVQLTNLAKTYESDGSRVMAYADPIEGEENVWEHADMPYIAAFCLLSNDLRHEALERIMPDLAIAQPGSAHDILERGLLRPGDTFVHDRIGHCVIAIKRS